MTKKTIIVAAVLLLAAALFVGAGAADEIVVTDASTLLDKINSAPSTGDPADYVIKLGASFTTRGIKIDTPKVFTLDFDENTLTMSAPAVGSSGTESQGFHIEAGSKVVFKDGTIDIDSANPDWSTELEVSKGGKPIKMLIQNYADLSLESMTLDATNINHQKSDYSPSSQARYALSNNQGPVSITGTTSITVPNGDVAFDVCKFMSYNEPSVTVNTQGTITGKIEYSLKADDPQGCLDIKAGTFIGDIIIDSEAATPSKDNIKIEGGSFIVSSPAAKELIKSYTTSGSTVTINVGQSTLLTLNDPESFTLVIPAAFNFVKEGAVYVAKASQVGVTDLHLIVGNKVAVTVDSTASPTKWTLTGLETAYDATFDGVNMKSTDTPLTPFIKTAEDKLAEMKFTQNGNIPAGVHTDTLTFSASIVSS